MPARPPDAPPPSIPPELTAEAILLHLSEDARERLLNALARYLLEEEKRQQTLRRLRSLT